MINKLVDAEWARFSAEYAPRRLGEPVDEWDEDDMNQDEVVEQIASETERTYSPTERMHEMCGRWAKVATLVDQYWQETINGPPAELEWLDQRLRQCEAALSEI